MLLGLPHVKHNGLSRKQLPVKTNRDLFFLVLVTALIKTLLLTCGIS